MREWCVTETPEDPSLNPRWVGEARNAMHALDQFAVSEGFVPYSDLAETLPDEWGEGVGFGRIGGGEGKWAILHQHDGVRPPSAPGVRRVRKNTLYRPIRARRARFIETSAEAEVSTFTGRPCIAMRARVGH